MADDRQPQPINLDLIEMVQRARMMHDEDARPSDYAAVYWIEAKRGAGDYPAPTANAGEWRVRLSSPLHLRRHSRPRAHPSDSTDAP